MSAGDPSLLEHIETVTADSKIAVMHPLGQGLGRLELVRQSLCRGRCEPLDYAPGESALLTMFVDTGVVGGTLYGDLLSIWSGAGGQGPRANRAPGWQAALAMVAIVGGLSLIPITFTSDVWGDLCGDVPVLVGSRVRGLPGVLIVPPSNLAGAASGPRVAPT